MSDWETVKQGNDGWETVKAPGFAEGMGDVARGAVMPFTAIADAPYNAINLGKIAFGAGATAFGRPDLAPDVHPAPVGSYVQDLMTRAGVPDYQPQNFMQDLIKRVTQYTSAAMTGSAPLGGIQSVSTAVAPSVSAAGGATANSFFPDNPAAQVVGELLPSALTGGVSAGRRANVTPAQINAETIRSAGGNPTVNQTTGGAVPNFVERVGGQSPGGDRATFKNVQANNEGMGANLKEIASNVSPASSPTQAGRSIQTGIDKFITDFKGRWNTLDAKVAEHFDPTDGVPITNTLKKLDDMIASGKGAESSLSAVSGTERDALIRLRKSLTEDSSDVQKPATKSYMVPDEGFGQTEVPASPAVTGANQGQMSYQGFRQLRSAVGAKTASANLMSDIPTGTYKALYGAMSADLEAAAAAKGPEALKAYQNQNKVYAAGMKRIDDTLDPLANKAKPEDAYQAAIAGADKGATTLWSLRRSLPTQEWKDFVGTFVDRMGKANPNLQSAEGDQWSAQTFLTQWNKIDKQAKNALFGSVETPKLRQDLDTIAKASELVTKSGKMYANPSGTAPLLANASTAGGAVTALLLGHPGVAAAAGATVGGNYLTQRMMMNPKVVDWMAKGTSVPADKLPAFTSRLLAIGENANDQELKNDIKNYVEIVKPNLHMQPDMTGVRG